MNKTKKEIQFEQPSDLLLSANRFIIFIMAFVILAILIFGYLFILKPKINSISSVKLENTVTDERRKKNESLLTNLKELEAEYQDIMDNRQEDLVFLKKMVPQGPQVAEFFVIADSLAKKQGFRLLNIDISDSTPEKKPTIKEAIPNANSADAIPEEVAAQINTETASSSPAEINTIDDVLVNSDIKAMIVHISVSKTVGEDDDTLGLEIYNDFKDYVAQLENNIRLLDVQAIDFSEILAEGQAEYIFNLDLITYYQ
ncbi:MAG: hypothetical protein WCV71_00010 [Patescibacteria group bacterium]